MAPGEAQTAEQGQPEVEAHAGNEEEAQSKTSQRPGGTSESCGHIVFYLI